MPEAEAGVGGVLFPLSPGQLALRKTQKTSQHLTTDVVRAGVSYKFN